jgi:hypothetical protein
MYFWVNRVREDKTSFLAAYLNGDNLYIYYVRSLPDLKNKTDNKKTINGKIEINTFKTIFYGDFLAAVDSVTSKITNKQVNYFIKQDFTKLYA